MYTVDCEVESSEAASEETSPPPVVVLRYNVLLFVKVQWDKTDLSTQVEVAEEDGGLGAGDDQNHKHEEEKSVPEVKHIKLGLRIFRTHM